MVAKGFMKAVPAFTRKNIVLNNGLSEHNSDSLLPSKHNAPDVAECNVLVINADHEMAKELTLQLSIQIPGCSIVFAPTLALAKLMLRRRKIDFIVSSAILPDGSLRDLEQIICKIEQRPNVLVFGAMNMGQTDSFRDANYEIAGFRRFEQADPRQANLPLGPQNKSADKLQKHISTLGADIRNDLNNPLQEIVAMVFVAQAASADPDPNIQQALTAIDNAAKNMSEYVNELEGKIRDVVGISS